MSKLLGLYIIMALQIVEAALTVAQAATSFEYIFVGLLIMLTMGLACRVEIARKINIVLFLAHACLMAVGSIIACIVLLTLEDYQWDLTITLISLALNGAVIGYSWWAILYLGSEPVKEWFHTDKNQNEMDGSHKSPI